MNIHDLPDNLPTPLNDGLTNHLKGLSFPKTKVLSKMPDKFVLFIFPKVANDIEAKLDLEEWNAIPGARGCTPQSCSFRDTYSLFRELGYEVYGMSNQKKVVLESFSKKNHIPFSMLSDFERIIRDNLKLPTFFYNKQTLLKRVTIVVEQGVIEKVFYPVFPPNKNAFQVLEYLRNK